ncbi:Uncharacterized protein HZ326_3219 [Fusarium oxysporum f. sp. albedinis]|nr:Uncharacterized protein HZ326_3219 [Fusarium oxysporum f. sp. albedinis]
MLMICKSSPVQPLNGIITCVARSAHSHKGSGYLLNTDTLTTRVAMLCNNPLAHCFSILTYYRLSSLSLSLSLQDSEACTNKNG